MTNERPPKPKKKHHLRDATDPALVAEIESNEWAGPIGGKLKDGRTLVDPRLHGKKERR